MKKTRRNLGATREITTPRDPGRRGQLSPKSPAAYRLGEHESSNCVRFVAMHATAERRRGSFLAHGMDGASIETPQKCVFDKSGINILGISGPSKRERRWRCQPALSQ